MYAVATLLPIFTSAKSTKNQDPVLKIPQNTPTYLRNNLGWSSCS